MSANLTKLMEMLQRAKDGPPMTDREWDTKVIPETVRNLLKKHDLAGTFNKDQPVNQDLELADRFFEAGLEMAVEVGMFCIDTDSVIKCSREEILQATEEAPSELTMGEGTDRITIKTRRPEDPYPPVFGAPLSIQVSEELYVPIVTGILQSRQVRIHNGPSLDTVYGYPAYSGSPFESALALLENQLRREAQQRAGRPGMPNSAISSSTTEFGQFSGLPHISTASNRVLGSILHPAELKVHFASFHKAIAAIGCGAYLNCGSYGMIGGYSGPAEGAVLTNIATDLLQFPVLQAHASSTSIYDVRFDSTVGRHGLWSLSMVNQALSRNTHMITNKIINQLAGPCTEEILYTSAAGLICGCVSGQTLSYGPRSAGGRFKDYLTPLEHWFCASVFEAATRLTLGEANEIVLYLLSTYEDKLKDMVEMKGKSFTECFDPKTLRPSKEWAEIGDKVKADIESHGLALPYVANQEDWVKERVKPVGYDGTVVRGTGV
jgi:methylamine--corrinoid protein Co-methyltransferase